MFVTHTLSLKRAASGDFFSERNLCNGSRNSNTMVSDIPRDNHLIPVFKRRLL